MAKDADGNELNIGDKVEYLSTTCSILRVNNGDVYIVDYLDGDCWVVLAETGIPMNVKHFRKVEVVEDIIVEITQAEYDELHEELALKDSIIGDLQAELEDTKKLLKLADKMERFLKWYRDDEEIVVGSKVKLRTDSEWNDGTSSNPLEVVGKVINIREDDKEFPVEVRWDDSFSNVYHYRDLELA